ncbi:hypothetical protein BCR44DRAFT_1441745, partial [Catenaria anguillulae PL171]
MYVCPRQSNESFLSAAHSLWLVAVGLGRDRAHLIKVVHNTKPSSSFVPPPPSAAAQNDGWAGRAIKMSDHPTSNLVCCSPSSLHSTCT